MSQKRDMGHPFSVRELNLRDLGHPPTSWAQYNAGTNQITSTNQNAGESYDQAGHITYDGVNSYLYDGEGRICAAEQQTVGGTTMTQYIYDAEGNRVAKGTISSWSCNTATNGFTASAVWVVGVGRAIV